MQRLNVKHLGAFGRFFLGEETESPKATICFCSLKKFKTMQANEDPISVNNRKGTNVS